MLHEYRDIISKLKVENAHFAKIFERHNELDEIVTEVEEGRKHMSDLELEKLKKENIINKLRMIHFHIGSQINDIAPV